MKRLKTKLKITIREVKRIGLSVFAVKNIVFVKPTHVISVKFLTFDNVYYMKYTNDTFVKKKFLHRLSNVLLRLYVNKTRQINIYYYNTYDYYEINFVHIYVNPDI